MRVKIAVKDLLVCMLANGPHRSMPPILMHMCIQLWNVIGKH